MNGLLKDAPFIQTPFSLFNLVHHHGVTLTDIDWLVKNGHAVMTRRRGRTGYRIRQGMVGPAPKQNSGLRWWERR